MSRSIEESELLASRNALKQELHASKLLLNENGYKEEEYKAMLHSLEMNLAFQKEELAQAMKDSTNLQCLAQNEQVDQTRDQLQLQTRHSFRLPSIRAAIDGE